MSLSDNQFNELLDIIKTTISHELNGKLDTRFDAVDAKFSKMDARFEAMDKKFDEKLKPIYDELHILRADIASIKRNQEATTHVLNSISDQLGIN